MGFLFDGALSQKITHILFAGERALALVAKLRFMFFFRGFHSPDGDIGAGHFVPTTIKTAANRIFEKPAALQR